MGLPLPRAEYPPDTPTFSVRLHAKQGQAFLSTATEILYGGAAGGGKSHLMRVAAIAWCMAIPGLQVYLFRRVREDLIKNHMEGPKGFRALLAHMVNARAVEIIENEIRFPNGAKIYLCHCKDPKDVYKYQGAEIHVLLIDELTHFLEDMYRFLRNRVRMVGLAVPAMFEGRFPRILCSANPGNVGHLWVKKTWIEGRVPFAITQEPDDEGGMRRQYLPARLGDNPSLKTDDPGYERRLAGLGSPSLVKAMRDGDWDVVEGAYFEEWSNARHVIEPFPVPRDWMRFRSMDWGSAKPFSVGWWAVVQDDYRPPMQDTTYPRGALIRYREWYGCQPKKANVGLKMTVEAVAAGILAKSLPDTGRGIDYEYTVVDSSMFDVDGGPSQAETLIKAGVTGLRKANKRRVSVDKQPGGWDMLRARLRGTGWIEYSPGQYGPGPDWQPDLYCFSTCVDSIRTIPVLQHDPDRPEDLDTEAEDHAADDWRYAVMSRPYTRRAIEPKVDKAQLQYEAKTNADGTVSVVSSVSIREMVEARMRARKKR